MEGVRSALRRTDFLCDNISGNDCIGRYSKIIKIGSGEYHFVVK